MTERLYEKDAYCKNFKARVLSCEQIGDVDTCEQSEANEGTCYKVVLDRTAFFPEGGGQAPDAGFIGDAEVVDVQIFDDTIVHTTCVPMSVGAEIEGRIDWDLRFERMQSHSGEHIISGVIHSLFGYDNVGFHMGESIMTVDCSGVLTAEDIERIELEANHAIYKNVEITATFPSKEELAQIEYRSKIDFTDGVRLVNIDGVDCCACCAPHVARTGEVGIVKILSFISYKGGTRIEMVAGVNALKDYMTLNNVNRQLMGELSAPRNNIMAAVERKSEQLNVLHAENKGLMKRLALAELTPVKVGRSAYALMDGVKFDEIRLCANTVMEQGAKVCVVLSKVVDVEGGQHEVDKGAGVDGKCEERYGDRSTCADDYLYVVSSKCEDVRSIVKEINAAFNGKGGGKPEYAQGKLVVEVEAMLKEFVEEILTGI